MSLAESVVHIHACGSCTPTVTPTGGVRHDHHYGVRFHDWPLWVRKLGEGTISDCYEIDLKRGIAWRFSSPLHYCDCGSHDVCRWIDRSYGYTVGVATRK
jgi:hypothetical protein